MFTRTHRGAHSTRGIVCPVPISPLPRDEKGPVSRFGWVRSPCGFLSAALERWDPIACGPPLPRVKLEDGPSCIPDPPPWNRCRLPCGHPARGLTETRFSCPQSGWLEGCGIRLDLAHLPVCKRDAGAPPISRRFPGDCAPLFTPTIAAGARRLVPAARVSDRTDWQCRCHRAPSAPATDLLRS